MAVAAASRHGGTCEIADRISVTLAAELPESWSVVRTDLRDLRAFDAADAVVLGSAVYYSHWMHAAGRALHYVKDAPLLDLWLFSTGPISEADSKAAQVPSADAMVADGLAVDHQVFGGRLDTSLLGWAERAAVRAVHALPGDHRDWDQVDDWARRIAGQLAAVPERQNAPRGSGHRGASGE
ncbi:flavodoxin domain-containing protein [Aeromicrobium sp. A1-2]|uniref:flavodoxin domain-containing protein n=1 Tax=Aeromicrobium sp. A1-2 TaxID=2107713 RepID=UPI0013C2FF4B|nr:flavodoxin domain-containing protein [Aeromicrobium sp. A1-2]